jgi:hypothetical protein
MPDKEIIEPHAVYSEASGFEELFAELESRCKTPSIKVEQLQGLGSQRYVRVHIPAGRQTEPVAVFGSEGIRELLSIPFEKQVFIGGYDAICCYEDGVIEAGIAGTIGSMSTLRRRIYGSRSDPAGLDQDFPPLEIPNPGRREKLVLGVATTLFKTLTRGMSSRPSLRIEGLSLSRQDQAIETLERIANSFFFQLDLLRGVAFTLRRRRALRTVYGKETLASQELEFPKSDYDRDPISLYWYARGARGMPLLQFLAYYQTLEYYFPAYSQAEARRKIRNILKNPTFRPERDTDVAKILLAAQLNGLGYGDERSQLRATLNECLEPGALRAFLTDSEERAKYFSSKTDSLTDQKIQIRNPDADLRNDVADRIYDIRCKIVHTKSGGPGGEVELLLPFSKEAELLYADIELIQFVAREVLVSASTPLRLGDETLPKK